MGPVGDARYQGERKGHTRGAVSVHEAGPLRSVQRGGLIIGTVRKPRNYVLLPALERLGRVAPPQGDAGAGPEGHRK